MPQWKWAGFDVLEDWAEGKHPRIVQAVYDAMFRAVDEPHPGQEVPFSTTGSRRAGWPIPKTGACWCIRTSPASTISPPPSWPS